ncbi:MAG: hypothetical protein QOD82_4669, partial [Pseudonocardiales bacterium]|nr:hypothetical protein [Pseudonocardiales bacterium]
MTTGRRYGGADAHKAAIVDTITAEDAVLSSAIELARPLASKPGATLGMIKSRMFPNALAALRNVDANNFG